VEGNSKGFTHNERPALPSLPPFLPPSLPPSHHPLTDYVAKQCQNPVLILILPSPPPSLASLPQSLPFFLAGLVSLRYRLSTPPAKPFTYSSLPPFLPSPPSLSPSPSSSPAWFPCATAPPPLLPTLTLLPAGRLRTSRPFSFFWQNGHGSWVCVRSAPRYVSPSLPPSLPSSFRMCVCLLPSSRPPFHPPSCFRTSRPS